MNIKDTQEYNGVLQPGVLYFVDTSMEIIGKNILHLFGRWKLNGTEIIRQVLNIQTSIPLELSPSGHHALVYVESVEAPADDMGNVIPLPPIPDKINPDEERFRQWAIAAGLMPATNPVVVDDAEPDEDYDPFDIPIDYDSLVDEDQESLPEEEEPLPEPPPEPEVENLPTVETPLQTTGEQQAAAD